MKLRLLIGRAGSGKTHTCLSEITKRLAQSESGERAPLCFLVPEQATFQMERALLEHRPDVSAVARARVLSFKRLSHLAMEQTGPTTRAHLGELGKLLAFQIAVERERAHLGAFVRAAQTEGFLESVAATYAELRAYNVRMDALHQVADLLEPESEAQAAQKVNAEPAHLLTRKLLDVARIGAAYERFIAGRFHDSESSLELAAQALRQTNLLHGASVWIDGFAGFTPQEYELLKTLMLQCDEVTLALCLDPAYVMNVPAERWEEGPPDSLFHPTRETLVRLREAAHAVGVDEIECESLPVSMGAEDEQDSVAPRFLANPRLDALERTLVDQSVDRSKGERGSVDDALPGTDGREGDVTFAAVIEAPHRYAEVEAAAREIRRLVRQEGMRYADIAVVVRDLGPYRSAVESLFTEWEIPFFLDYKPVAHHHPVVRLLSGLFDLCRHGVRTESLVRCLKTDLLPLSRADVDALENEAIRRGIDGEVWLQQETWVGTEFEEVCRRGLESVATFVRRIEALRKQGPGAGQAAQFLAVVSGFLNDVRVNEQLAQWSQAATDAGDPLLANEHVQVWNALLDLLNQVHEVLGEERITFEEFYAALNAGLQRMRLGRVPPKIDQVLVGSVERSRQPDLKCTILLGMNDGEFPAIPAEDPILSDDDRARLHDVGVELGPGSRQRLFHEEYLLYIALTRPSQRLVLTHSRSDDSGRPLRPSPAIRRLLERFPDIPIHTLATRPTDEEWPERPASLAGWLARVCRDSVDGKAHARPAQERVLAAYDWMLRADGERPTWADPLHALVYRNTSGSLSPDLVAALYGTEWVTSASRLEDLASCSFKHFAGHGLRLRERRPPQMDAATMGTLAHAVLSAFVRSLERDGVEWSKLTRTQCDERVDVAVDEALEAWTLAPEAVQSAASRYVLRRLRAALKAVVWALGEHSRKGRFRPFAVELGFGASELLPPVVVRTPGGRLAHIQGRIDRLDVAEEDGRRWMRVIDYKSSRRPFQLGRLAHGIDLQLVVYLLAATAGMDDEALLPAGCLYLPVYDPVVSAEAPAPSDEEGWRKELKGAGIVVEDEGVPRLMDAESVGHSDIVPLYFKKDGSLGSNSKSVSSRRMHQLLEFTRLVVGRLIDEWAEGLTQIAPYQTSNESACTFCAYRSVCQFDVTLPSNRYRQIDVLPEEPLWQRIEETTLGGDARVG